MSWDFLHEPEFEKNSTGSRVRAEEVEPREVLSLCCEFLPLNDDAAASVDPPKHRSATRLVGTAFGPRTAAGLSVRSI